MQVFPLRGGRMVDRYSFHLENAAGDDPLEVLEGFCIEYYGTAPSMPPQMLVPRGLGDLSALGGFLSELRGSRVEVRAPGARREAPAAGARPAATPSSRSRRRRFVAETQAAARVSRRSRSCARC